MGKGSRTGEVAGLRTKVGKTPGEIHRGTIEDILKEHLFNDISRVRVAMLKQVWTGEKDEKSVD